jgi:hypothetical protein
MIKKLIEELFKKIEGESDNDRKTKNGNSIYFVEKILDEKLGKPNYISSKAIKGYYDKYVEGRENNSGEPSSDLKNLIAKYLGFKDFLNFEKEKGKKGFNIKSNTRLIVLLIIFLLIFSGFYYNKVFYDKDCIVWRIDHYEKIDCKIEFSEPIFEGLNIEKFKKINVSDTTTFFIKGKPIVWYGKSNNGEIQYFNSRGEHPITKKELKPITKHMINKYIYKKE